MTRKQKKRIKEYLNILKEQPAFYQVADKLLKDADIDFTKAIYYTVFAPVLVSFVEWVLEEAEKKGIRRLYFLARDGYQMYLTAKYLCKIKQQNIECRYLYGSRYAWRIPQFALERETCLDKICLAGIAITFENIMKRGGLTEEEAWIVARELGFMENYQKVLSYQEVVQLKKPLAESKNFLSFVYAHSKEAYEDTIGYLRQEGLLENVRYAVVDVGWVGSQQKVLSELLHQMGCQNQLVGFYFGLYEIPKQMKKGNYYTYYFHPDNGIKRKTYFSSCLFEAVFSAPHGMTVAYQKQGSGYAPIFYKEQSLNQKYMEQMAVWLEKFLHQYLGNKENNIKVVYQLLKNFMGNPIKEEAETYGQLLFSDDVNEEYIQNVAWKLTNEELNKHYVWNKILIMLAIKKQDLKESAWIEGSIALNGEQTKWRLIHVRCYKYLVYIRKWLKKGK